MKDGRISKASEGFAAFLVAVALYLPFLSRHYEQNGVAEARALRQGILFSANHLLYRPAGLLIQDAARFCGFRLSSISSLQLTTAVCGAAGIALAYLFFRTIANGRFVPAVVAFWLATSWAYWTFSTDAIYIPVAAMWVAAALLIFVSSRSRAGLMVAGTFTGFAILTWQANIFLLAVFWSGLYFIRAKRRNELIPSGLIFAAVCAFPVVVMYMLAALSKGIRSPAKFLYWVTTHGDGVGLPIWGQLNWQYLVNTSHSMIGSIVPIGSKAGLVALTLMVLTSLCAAVETIRTNASGGLRISAWLLTSYLVYLPFIIWFDQAKEWFVVLNIFLGGIFVNILGRPGVGRMPRVVLAPLVCVIAGVNFSSTILPQTRTPNPYLEIARCVASRTGASDLVVSADWNWTDYTRYFFNRNSISLISEVGITGDARAALSNVRQKIIQTQWLHGDVYFPDPASYSKSHLSWLRSGIGLALEDLSELRGEYAFECGGTRFLRARPLTDRAVRGPDGKVWRTTLEGEPVLRTPMQKVSLNIKSAAGTRVSTAGIASESTVGYARLVAAQGLLPTGFGISRFYLGNSLLAESLNFLRTATKSGLFPVEIENSIDTAVAITNPNSVSARIDFTFRNSNGVPLKIGTIDVPRYAQLSRFLSEQPFFATSELAGGTLGFRANVPVFLMGLRVDQQPSRLFFSRIAVGQEVMTEIGKNVIPYFIAGGGWVSQIVLVNPAHSKSSGKIVYTFADSQSTGRAENRVLEYLIPARGVQRLRISGKERSRIGYAVVQPVDGTTTPLTSVLLLHDEGTRPTDNALIEALAPESVQTLYVERNGNFLSTDVVMANPSDKQVVARLKLSKLDKAEEGIEQWVTVPPFGMQTVRLDELENNPFRPKSFEGVLRIETRLGSRITAVSVRRAADRTNEVIYSLIPPMEAFPRLEQKSVVLPQIVDSGGYISHLVLVNTSQNDSAVAVDFFSNSGKPMHHLIVN
jgi:hypothetical protein